MLRKLYLVNFIIALLFLPDLIFAGPYYVVDTNPWGQTCNITAMNNVYGVGNWTQSNYAGNAVTIFSPTTHFVMLEGSENNATALADFLTAHHTLIENWVSAGGRLFINAAPNQGSDIDFGFNGTVLHYIPTFYSSNATAFALNDTIFHGPYLPVANAYTATYTAHGYITGNSIDTLVVGDSSRVILAAQNWGSGTVYFGAFTQPVYWTPYVQTLNLWYNIMSDVHGFIIPAAAGVLDSFEVFTSNTCSAVDLTVRTDSFHNGLSVKTWWGDNTTDSNAIIQVNPPGGTASVTHNYANSGNYTIKEVLYSNNNAIDSTSFAHAFQLCSAVLVSFYYDGNLNCQYDSSELLINQPVLTEIDSNNVPIDTVSALSGFYYTVAGNQGDVFKFKLLSAGGYYASCPVSGELYDTIGINNNNVNDLTLGMSCAVGNNFDFSVNPSTHSGRHLSDVTVDLSNLYCSVMNGILTMNFSPKYAFSNSYPSPASQNQQTITWNINGLSANASQQLTIDLVLPIAQPWLTIGDTVNYSFVITPTAGDLDTVNNMVIIHDTISGAWDPNIMQVSPQGYILSGTKLKYTIGFENTGNAPAENIYVLDTLPDEVDIHSLRMVASSAKMLSAIYKASGHNIVKFEFPGINLPDSFHNPHNCTGMLSFTINTKTGLPFGTHILNDAGIYFDYNDVVMTNTAENIIGFPANVNNLTSESKVQLYPNPVADQLTIKTTDGKYNSLTITNTMGQVVTQQSMNGAVTKVNTNSLPPGVYYIEFMGSNGTETREFVKL